MSLITTQHTDNFFLGSGSLKINRYVNGALEGEQRTHGQAGFFL